MYRNDPFRGGGWSSWGGAPSRDILVLLGVVFATFSLQFFNATAIVPAALRLTPAAWRYGFLWQLFTYPFVGIGGASLWFLLALLMIYMFGRDVFFQLGRRNFWKLTLWSCVPAAVVGLAVDGVMRLTGGSGHPSLW